MTKNFYSNVFLSGENIYYIGYENGERVQYKDQFSPVLFAQTNKQTEYKTLDGNYAQKFEFGGINDAKEFINNHKDVENFKIYGNDKFLYQYLNSNFTEEIDYDKVWDDDEYREEIDNRRMAIQDELYQKGTEI